VFLKFLALLDPYKSSLDNEVGDVDTKNPDIHIIKGSIEIYESEFVGGVRNYTILSNENATIFMKNSNVTNSKVTFVSFPELCFAVFVFQRDVPNDLER
jgi:hypothetical protein